MGDFFGYLVADIFCVIFCRKPFADVAWLAQRADGLFGGKGVYGGIFAGCPYCPASDDLELPRH